MRSGLWTLGLLFGISFVGCDSGGGAPSPPVEQTNQPTSNTELKQRLNEIAQSGQAGSALAGVRESIEQMKASDPQKAEALLKDLDKLESTGDPSQVKAIAKRMADQL